MTATELLATARRNGLQFRVSGDRVRVGPRSRLTPELEAQLRERKAELLPLLNSVRIEPVIDAGRVVYRLVKASTGEPLLAGLFASENWARAWCAEHDLVPAAADVR